MIKMSKNIIKFLILGSIMIATFSLAIANADSALNALFWSDKKTKIIPNCTIRLEDNPYTQQITPNEVCYPRTVDVQTRPSYSRTVPDTVYTGTSINYPKATYNGYYTGNNGATGFSASDYLLSSFGRGGNYGNSYLNSFNYPSYNGGYWNNSNNYGYYNEGLFDTYYRGGPSDYSGFYSDYSTYEAPYDNFNYNNYFGDYNSDDYDYSYYFGGSLYSSGESYSESLESDFGLGYGDTI